MSMNSRRGVIAVVEVIAFRISARCGILIKDGAARAGLGGVRDAVAGSLELNLIEEFPPTAGLEGGVGKLLP